jgi:hypothetical protein
MTPSRSSFFVGNGNDNRLLSEGHAVAGYQLFALLGFDRSVQFHLSFGYQILRFTPTIRQVSKFEKLAEFDGNFPDDNWARGHVLGQA